MYKGDWIINQTICIKEKKYFLTLLTFFFISSKSVSIFASYYYQSFENFPRDLSKRIFVTFLCLKLNT